jgi:DNA-directed RNA polymerase subunit K/omega
MPSTLDTDLDPDSLEASTDPAAPITSRFLFVDVAAQRAKQLRRGALPRVDRSVAATPHKLERVAMEEVRTGLVQYSLPTTYEGAGHKPHRV